MGQGAPCWCAIYPLLTMTPHPHEKSEPNTCPRCGQPQLPMDYYCWACGHQLDYGAVIN
jgi:predicted amidophosphoribosyltransferase